MEGHNLIAIYGARIEAERARARLGEIGIPATDIRMSAGEWSAMTGASEMAATPTPAPHREGFWDWLFGRDMPEDDRRWYEANLREGRTALSVFVRDAQEHDRVAEVLEEFDPIFVGPHPTHNGRSAPAAGTGLPAPKRALANR